MPAHWSYHTERSSGLYIGKLSMFGVVSDVTRYTTHSEIVMVVPFPVYEALVDFNNKSEPRKTTKVREVIVGDRHFVDAIRRAEYMMQDVLRIGLTYKKTGIVQLLKFRQVPDGWVNPQPKAGRPKKGRTKVD